MTTFDYSEPILVARREDLAGVGHRRVALRHPVVVAMSFRVTDMGNQVTRIKDIARISFDDAKAGGWMADSEPLPQPVPPKIDDAVTQVLGSFGIAPPQRHALVIEGYTRPISDDSFEVVAWVALMV